MFNNLPDMFVQTCERHGQKTVIKFKKDGEYRSMDYLSARQEVFHLAAGLMALGLKQGDKVAIIAETRYQWAFSDYAILSCGAVTVPVYPTMLADQITYILNDSQARMVIVSSKVLMDKILEAEKEIPGVTQFILMDPEDASNEKITFYHDVLEKGKKYLDENPDVLTRKIAAIGREDLATIIYTSGTTGEPKGVMLGHHQLLSNVEATLRAVDINTGDTFLSFLPLSHVFERMAGHYLPMHAGATIAYAESIDTVPENLQEIAPTIMTAVPRLFEKIYGKVVSSVEEGSGLKRKLFYWALGIGRKVIEEKQNNRPLPGGLKFKYGIATKLVFSKLQARVGGNIRFFVSGGAPLPREIGEFFTAAGLLILEGYGITETSPVISVNRIEKFKMGSVGLPLDNAEVKIAEDGEILTRGPAVMLGYFNKESETREAIDADNWYYTGDIGHFDKDGMLVITDRKKNIIVTAGGKNIAPQRIENMLVTSRYVEQTVVLGDKRKYCTALIVPSFENIEKYAQEKGIAFKTHKDLCENSQIIQLIQTEVNAVNENCASYESVKKFLLVERPFSIESGELTPSLKVKRKEVETNYAAQIKSMYPDN